MPLRPCYTERPPMHPVMKGQFISGKYTNSSADNNKEVPLTGVTYAQFAPTSYQAPRGMSPYRAWWDTDANRAVQKLGW